VRAKDSTKFSNFSVKFFFQIFFSNFFFIFIRSQLRVCLQKFGGSKAVSFGRKEVRTMRVRANDTQNYFKIFREFFFSIFFGIFVS
jgi:hypothetical protein